MPGSPSRWYRAAAGLGLWLLVSAAQADSSNVLVDISPGASGSNPIFGLTFNNQVLFGANDGNGYALWRTDGTATGTVRVGTGSPIHGSFGPTGAQPGDFVVYTGADADGNAGMWRTDGTAAGTELLQDLRYPSLFVGVDYNPISCGGIVVLGNQAFYGASPGDASGLFQTDGTVAGTVEVGTFPGNLSMPANTPVCALAAFDDSVFFSWGNPASGSSTLWRSNGEPGVYEPVLDDSGDQMQAPSLMQELGGALYFFAPMYGQIGLWRLGAGDPVAHLVFNKYWTAGSESPAIDGTVGNVLLFRDYYQAPGELLPTMAMFGTDGTTAGTYELSHIQSVHIPRPYGAQLGNRFLYTGPTDPSGVPVYVTDGTAAGTTSFYIPRADYQDLISPEIMVLNGKAYITLQHAVAGIMRSELWRTDGTQQGTVQVDAVPYLARYDNAVHLAVAGGRLVFPAESGQYGVEPWFYDPTPAGNIGTGVVGSSGGGGGRLYWFDVLALALLLARRSARPTGAGLNS